MDERVWTALAANEGLVTTEVLAERGIERHRVDAWVRRGDLVALRRGVYTDRARWEAWDDDKARPRQRILAADLTLQVRAVYSHESAALLLGLPVLGARSHDVHVTREDVRGSRTRFGVRHHGAPYLPSEVVMTDFGLPCLGPARTVADVARAHGHAAGLVVADATLRTGVARGELYAVSQRMRSWPGVTTVRTVLDDADRGAESPGETLARILIGELGIGRAETQFPVPVNSGVRWCDLRVGRHLFEFDGRVEYRRTEHGGYAANGAEQALWDEKVREREVTQLGLGMSRIVWADFWGPARARARRRLRAEYDSTCRRFGTELPEELLHFARGRHLLPPAG